MSYVHVQQGSHERTAYDWGNVVAVALLLLFASSYVAKAWDSSGVWRNSTQWSSVHVTVLGREGNWTLVREVANRSLIVTNYVDQVRLSAYMYANWLALSEAMGCQDSKRNFTEALEEGVGEISSPACSCAVQEFWKQLRHQEQVLLSVQAERGVNCSQGRRDQISSEETGCTRENGALQAVMAPIRAYQDNVYTPAVLDCVSHNRNTFTIRLLGNGCKEYAQLDPLVLVVCILGTSALASLHALYPSLLLGCWRRASWPRRAG